MFKRFTLFFTILAVLILCVSNVSADDSIDTNVSDLDDLAIKINQTLDGQTVNLDCDYQSTDSTFDYIVIDKAMTIDGANHTIDARDVKRVFWVKADNVCIKNINFINARTTGLAGGVISWWGNNGTLENCNFVNNSAISAGGAVLWNGNAGNITNCNFTGNDVRFGAATSLTDGAGFDPSQPHIQVVNSEGGALFLGGNNISVDSCNFYDNVALLNGGAVYVHWHARNASISNSRFKNNTAEYNGGAIDWEGENAVLSNSIFEDNSPNTLFLNTNAVIENSTFDKFGSIESWGNVTYLNIVFNDFGSFDELAYRVNMTPEGGILILDKDYGYVNGSNKGVLISKPITIDGAGHTLNGNHLSRMFNVTADNVVIKNINFINGNAFGRYGGIAGGGAIYWSGANGLVENCSFTNNTGSGIEDDPFDKETTYVDENGTVWHTIRIRPMGAKINEGGAIVWNGTNGTVSKCVFNRNIVGYPNSGGAICWRGACGKIIASEFYNNDAWCGAAICWVGDNGTISYSIVANSTFFDGGIYWFGKGGCVKNSILIDSSFRGILRGADVTADYNFWGDTLENPNAMGKVKGLSNWILIKFSNNGQFIEKGQSVVIKYDMTTLIDSNGKMSDYYALSNRSSQMTYTADKSGFLNITYLNGKVIVNVDAKETIKSGDLTAYYAKRISYCVNVYDYAGKVVGKKVKFTINKNHYYVTTDRNGAATLKINLKPGKYTVNVRYGDVNVKKRITVKSSLITKNVVKKAKKTGKFTAKVLNSKGKAFAKKTVKVRFKGKTYNIKTNSKGIASFKIPKNLKPGIYIVKTSYEGLTNSNVIVVNR